MSQHSVSSGQPEPDASSNLDYGQPRPATATFQVAEDGFRPFGTRGALATGAVLLFSALAGVLGGLAWKTLATRQGVDIFDKVVYPVTNEPNGFFGNDAWYCLIALIGGILIGGLGYFFAIRRYGPVPMVAVIAGAVGAAFLALWVGQNPTVAQFSHQLATSPANTVIAVKAPIALAAKSAIAFWPLAACLVAGALALVLGRRRDADRT